MTSSGGRVHDLHEQRKILAKISLGVAWMLSEEDPMMQSKGQDQARKENMVARSRGSHRAS